MSVRTGMAYDVHRLVEGRPLIIGGVEIPGAERGLDGHSDADVLTHAVMDALLGAAALGDTGDHFPDDDERWRGADSLGLLTAVGERVAEAGYAIVNVDGMVICERPKLAPHREAMRAGLAAAVGLGVAAVSVKFTTNERIGFLGRGEGVAAMAVATLEGAPPAGPGGLPSGA